MHQQTFKKVKNWPSYCQIYEMQAKRVELLEYYHKYVNS